jgi:hypothetical protein
MSFRSLRISLVSAVLAATFALPLVAGARPKPAPTPSPTPTPVADPAITKIARQQFVAWQAGTVNRSAYDPGVQAKLSQDKIDDVSRRLGTLGPLTDTVYIGPLITSDLPPNAHGYIYQMVCREGAVYLWMILDGQGKIATIFFKDKLTTETVEVPATAAPSPTP